MFDHVICSVMQWMGGTCRLLDCGARFALRRCHRQLLVSERTQKCQEIFLFLRRQYDFLHVLGKVCRDATTADVVLHDVSERCGGSIMKVRRGSGDIAQTRRLEGAFVHSYRLDLVTSQVGRCAAVRGKAGIVKTIVREMRRLVTGRTVSFFGIVENAKAAYLLRAHRCAIASQPLVKRRMGAHDRT